MNDRLQETDKKSPVKFQSREQLKKSFFKQIRQKRNVVLKDPSMLKKFFVKKSYVDMQEEKDRRKKQKEL